jgi:hypothetical protein
MQEPGQEGLGRAMLVVRSESPRRAAGDVCLRPEAVAQTPAPSGPSETIS